MRDVSANRKRAYLHKHTPKVSNLETFNYISETMRIIARATLRSFWQKHADAETPLKSWFLEVKKAEWKSFNQLKSQFGNASVVGNDRVIFNIKGNDYRLVAAIDYEKQIMWIRFIGTHKEYDKINVKTI